MSRSASAGCRRNLAIPSPDLLKRKSSSRRASGLVGGGYPVRYLAASNDGCRLNQFLLKICHRSLGTRLSLRKHLADHARVMVVFMMFLMLVVRVLRVVLVSFVRMPMLGMLGMLGMLVRGIMMIVRMVITRRAFLAACCDATRRMRRVVVDNQVPTASQYGQESVGEDRGPRADASNPGGHGHRDQGKPARHVRTSTCRSSDLRDRQVGRSSRKIR